MLIGLRQREGVVLKGEHFYRSNIIFTTKAWAFFMIYKLPLTGLMIRKKIDVWAMIIQPSQFKKKTSLSSVTKESNVVTFQKSPPKMDYFAFGIEAHISLYSTFKYLKGHKLGAHTHSN